MGRFKWASAAAGALIGVLATTAGVAVPSAPVQALAGACQIGNDTDVAVANIALLGYGAQSNIAMPSCQSGKGSRVRVDYRLRNLDPQRPLNVYVAAPDGTTRWLQNSTVPGTADLADTQRWTTSATSSKGTWSLGVYGNGAAVIIDSWKVWVIPGSCWRLNDQDVTATGGDWYLDNSDWWHKWQPPVPASTTVWSACTGRASSDMRIEARVWNVPRDYYDEYVYGLRLYRNGQEVPMTIVSETVLGYTDDWRAHLDVVLTADGSQLMAEGHWTLEVRAGTDEHGDEWSDVTLDRWMLHTSY